MRQLLLQISCSSERARGKKINKKTNLKFIFTLPLHLTSHRAANEKGRFWKKDGLVEEKRNHRIMEKSRRLLPQEQHLITKVTFQFESMTSSARNASSIVLCHMEVVKNWSRTFSNAALKNFPLANTVFQSWHWKREVGGAIFERMQKAKI